MKDSMRQIIEETAPKKSNTYVMRKYGEMTVLIFSLIKGQFWEDIDATFEKDEKVSDKSRG